MADKYYRRNKEIKNDNSIDELTNITLNLQRKNRKII